MAECELTEGLGMALLATVFSLCYQLVACSCIREGGREGRKIEGDNG